MSTKNVTIEGVSSQTNITTLSAITNKWKTMKNQGNVYQLAQEAIRIPLMTAGGRILYLPLVQLTRDQFGVYIQSNLKKNLPFPIAYLQFDPLNYRPATKQEVIEDQKRITGKNYNDVKIDDLVNSLTFISNALA